MANKKFKIKKGDQVVIIAGDDKGRTGEVLKVIPRKNTVIVAGVNIVKKAVKPDEQNKDGGFVNKEMPIHISNIKKAEG